MKPVTTSHDRDGLHRQSTARLDWWHVLGALLMAGSTVVVIFALWALCAVLVAAAAGWPQ